MISGLSGSGKTTALRALEDAGYFCVDNLPTPLVDTFIHLLEDNPDIERAALVVDVREVSYYPDVPRRLGALATDHPGLRLLFLHARDDRLINRFKETRRRHPLMARGLADSIAQAIARERAWLDPIRALATAEIDTSDLTVHELKRRIGTHFADPEEIGMDLALISFGYRHGLPAEADYVFDVRFLPNPYFVEELRPCTGLDPAVAAYVFDSQEASMMLDRIEGMLAEVLPLAEREGKAHVTIAVGCTGGHHRSVAMVEALRACLGARGYDAHVNHRDIER